MRSLTRAVCLVILPKVKFLAGGKGFGSFEQPDFTNPSCWVNKVFDRMPHLKNASDKMKAEIWMTYHSKIKEQFSLHRSGVTLRIKKAFMAGEYLQHCFCTASSKILTKLSWFLLSELKKHLTPASQLAFPHGSAIFFLLKALDDKKIHKVRDQNNDNLFMLCAEICFPSLVSKQKWKNNHQHVAISNLITIADESLALLILENNYLEWIELSKGNAIDKNNRLMKYTYGGENQNGTKKGWSLEGKLRFNTIFDECQVQREKRASKDMESRIKAVWHERNPVNAQAERNQDMTTAQNEESQYVPRSDFDLE